MADIFPSVQSGKLYGTVNHTDVDVLLSSIQLVQARLLQCVGHQSGPSRKAQQRPLRPAPQAFEGGRRLHLRRRSALLIAPAAWIARKVARSVDFAKVTYCASLLFVQDAAKVRFPPGAARSVPGPKPTFTVRIDVASQLPRSSL
ncbi:hypothetical protein ACGYLX_15865 [Sulfitobacter sp. 1A13496]|uniref:hypothetical protein n=1 Tax=Sulfitobacter sp. 1A13496 TaxID=3368596 RepID=UPI003744CE6D